jgi:predicted pyridoxine 5'-phosphate oxidase superfamily flavin-nucleotide-binding protein
MPYSAMSEHQWRAFLRSPVRPALLATTRKDGRPHVTPIWYHLDDDGTIVFNTGAVRGLGHRGRRPNPRRADGARLRSCRTIAPHPTTRATRS